MVSACIAPTITRFPSLRLPSTNTRPLSARTRLSLCSGTRLTACGSRSLKNNFAKLFFNDLDPQAVNRVPLHRDNLVRALKGRVLVEGRRKLGNRVIVGAMQAETMIDYIEPGCLVVLGDREDAQLKAIESGAAALVVTGDLLVSA